MPKPKIEFESLGTHWWIEVLDEEDDQIVERAILQRVRAFHNDYSRFIPESFIGRLNAKKILKQPPQELLDMLAYAQDMFKVTDGIFNISVGATLGQLGYGSAAKHSRAQDSFWDHCVFKEALISIPQDVEIDLGGFGKGWIIDEIGKILREYGRQYFVINGGGDILASSPVPIEFALEHPLDDTKMIGTTRMSYGALAVSSTKKRVWKKGNDSHHHIIDPRTQRPSNSQIIATFVRAESALMADTLATVLLIDPSQDNRLSKKYRLKTILLSEDQLLSS
jgi:thiamine biosynthesis lipoprotein